MPRKPERNVERPPATAVTAAGMRILRLLVGTPPKTVAELIDATQVTRTAVTEQLNELVAAGFVERTVERLPGRGRPRHLYGATDDALALLFACSPQLLVPAIWQAIVDVGGSELKRKVLQRVSRRLASRYKRQISAKTPQTRLARMAELIREEGGLVEIEKDRRGRLTMIKRSCPFLSMSDESRSVCCIDQEVLSMVVGAPVVRIADRQKGDPCCCFAIDLCNGR